MSTIKKEIFIASRFEEFKEVRSSLSVKIDQYKFMEAVDLNDNQASHRSPLAESLFHARKSEIMILLVGETYGTIPDGESKSYTHLEYEEANKESSNTRILVVCIGKSYEGKAIAYSDNPLLKDWQIELEKNHRLSKFGAGVSVNEIVDQIMIMLLSSLYDLNPSEDLDLGQDTELYLDVIREDDENFLKDEEVAFLDNQKAEIDGIDMLDTSEDKIEGFELLKIPGKLAALEQKKEAQNAIELKDYYTAIKHLRKALELRPLDFESNYWLAKLYVASAKKNLFYEIEEYLIRAAKIAQQEKNVFKASHCYQLIIQASIFSDKEHEGLKYIQLAEELTPNYARLYYEKSKFMLFFNHLEDAKSALIQAINIRIDILKEVAQDPFFTQYKNTINSVKKDFKDRLHKSCYAISLQTNEIKNILGLSAGSINLQDLSIYELWQKARFGFISQFRLVSNNIKNTNENQISQIEQEIEELKDKYNKDLVKHIDEYSQKIKTAEIQFNEQKVKTEQASTILIESYRMNMTVSLFISVIGFLIIIFGKHNLTLLLIPIGALVVSIIYMLKRKDLKKTQLEKTQLLLNKLEEEKSEIENKEEKGQQELQKTLRDKQYLCLQKIDDLKVLYTNISKAFHSFELNTVSRSTSKLVPFKSLNSAYYGVTIRVTPQAYTKYINSGNTIEILEDFPDHLDIETVNPEVSSFLGKVIKKDRDHIIISRYQAYSD